MSLLNQMLKDLAARQPAGGPAAVRPALPGPAAARVGPLLLIILLAALLGAAAGYWWLRPAPVPAASPQVTVPEPAQVIADESALVELRKVLVTSVPQPAPRAPDSEPLKQQSNQVTPTEPASADITQQPTTPASRVPNPASRTPVPIKQPSRLSPAEQAAAAYRDGLRLAEAGHLTAAAEQLAQAVRLQAANTDYRLAQANVLLRAGRGAAAARTLQDGIRRDPNAVSLVKLYAGLALSQNDNAAALAALHGATPPALTDDPAFHALLAATEQRAGNYAAAAETYRALVAFNPAQGEWWTGLGIALEHLGQPPDALAAYQRARQSRLPPALAQYVAERITALE